MTAISASKPIAVLGGTFDPVHAGHLRTALALQQQAGFSRVHLVPCADPYHKARSCTAADLRLRMLQVAVAAEPCLLADPRDIVRGGATYTVDTLRSLRQEIPQGVHISWVIGDDAAREMHHWHDWQGIFALANVLVVARPGVPAPDLQHWPAAWCADQQDYLASPCGLARRVELTQLDISSTEIRQLIAAGHSARYLTPDGVLDIIAEQHLYERSST